MKYEDVKVGQILAHIDDITTGPGPYNLKLVISKIASTMTIITCDIKYGNPTSYVIDNGTPVILSNARQFYPSELKTLTNTNDVFTGISTVKFVIETTEQLQILTQKYGESYFKESNGSLISEFPYYYVKRGYGSSGLTNLTKEQYDNYYAIPLKIENNILVLDGENPTGYTIIGRDLIKANI